MNHKVCAIGVVSAAVGINLIIGVLYAWSIFKDAILAPDNPGFAWDPSTVNDPYALCCLIFAISMVPAGILQDTAGPRVTALLGAVLGGIGFLLIANSTQYWIWMLGFGVFVGAGIGFAYASTTPAALKWFCHTKSAMITGIVVSGFALASTYIAPLATYLVHSRGLHQAMLFFSLQFFGLITLFTYFLKSPSAHHIPIGQAERRQPEHGKARQALDALEHEVKPVWQVLRNHQFWLLWTLLFIGAGAGLMIIGNIKPLAKLSMGDLAYLAIIILAVGDAFGRILAGVLSTRFGRRKVLSSVFFMQMLLMFNTYMASQSGSAAMIVFFATLIGINYGANLVLFPNLVKDFWGIRHFGLIYGMLFSAWGLGGFVMVKLSEHLQHLHGNNQTAFYIAGTLMLFGTGLSFLIDDSKDKARLAHRLAAAASQQPTTPESRATQAA